MSILSCFLTLSIKEQLWITILILTIFSLLVILCLPCSFSYEILMEDYKRKKSIFYSRYKDYIESCFYFQTLNIYKYEEMVKRMTKQIFKYNIKEPIFKNNNSNFQGYYNDSFPVQDLFENNDNKENILYEYCYNKDNNTCSEYKNILRNKYDSLDGLIFSHDMIHRFKDPFYDYSLIDSFFTINVNDSVIYGFNKKGLFRSFINTDIKNISNIANNKLDIYYKSIIFQQMNFVIDYLVNFLNLNLFLFNELFGQVVKEIYDLEEVLLFYDPNIPQIDAANAYAKAALGFYSMLELANDKCYLATHQKEEDKFYYFQFNLIEDYLGLINHLMNEQLKIDFIPLYSQNNTIISPALCIFFLLKGINFKISEKILNELYHNIHKGLSGIDACIYDKKILENKKIKEIFKANITHFLLTSNKIYQGLIELNQTYYLMKYSFPNLNTLKMFKSDYLYTDQIDFYLFSPFKEPMEFAEYIQNQYQNLFYLLIILIIYIWVFCFIVNMIIYFKVIKQILKPIYKLQEAIETNNIKDENIFKYEYDDIINEFFITCKELLTGKIDIKNKSKYAYQFNIIDEQEDNNKIIDKRKYERNIIINNKIMNDLINEQQNMMNYTKEIDINDVYNFNNNIMDKEKEENNDKYHKNINKINKNKNIEEDDNNIEPYKRMHKLAEYLYNYRCKVEENNITININNDKKSQKLRKMSSIEKNENKMTINVLKGKDITYLWYMEMKYNNNKSFNYKINENLDELLKD